MSVPYSSIADDVAANGDSDYEAAFARMSAETVNKDANISTADIKAYLIVTGKWLAIKRSTEDVAEVVRDSLDTFESFQLADPVMGAGYKSALQSQMAALKALGLIDATDEATVLAMGTQTDPKWPGLKPGHVQNAMVWRAEGKI